MGDYARDLERSAVVDEARKAAEIEHAYAERDAQLSGRYYVRAQTDGHKYVTGRFEGTSVDQAMDAAKAAIPGFTGVDDVWREAGANASRWQAANTAAEEGRAR